MALLSLRSKEIDEQRRRRETGSKKLNLSAPLMSVRRHHQVDAATTFATTSTSSDDEEHNQKQQPEEDQRRRRQEQRLSNGDGEGCEETGNNWESLRSPGAVPFVWERTPGTPKNDDKPRHCYRPPVVLPPGRMASPSRLSIVTDPSVPDEQRRKKAANLPSFFKLKRMPPPAPPADRQLDEEDDQVGPEMEPEDEDPFSDGPGTENRTLDPRPLKVADNNPVARDLIMRRFLPAAKAMADESTSASQARIAPPRSAPPTPTPAIRVPINPKKQQQQHVSASVERIQRGQYMFSSSNSIKVGDVADNDFFSTRACGFFSFSLLKRFPASRTRRLSDRANNRFASDGLRPEPTSEGSSEAEDEDEDVHTKKLTRPSASPDVFYDCEPSFDRSKLLFSPQVVRTPERISYSRKGSSLPPSKGFLGLPEDYKPPEDPYRNSGLSPSLKWRFSSNPTPEKGYHHQHLLGDQTLKDPIKDSLVRQIPSSPGSTYGTPERKSSSPPIAIAGFGNGNEGSWRQTTLSLRAAMRKSDLESASPQRQLSSPTININKAALVPPKSPSQSWLCKAIQPPHLTTTKWESTVKSRQLRPGHLRYSEENAYH